MLKDIVEVALNTVGDVVQSYARDRFPDESTAAEKRRLLMVMVIGAIVGLAVIALVIVLTL